MKKSRTLILVALIVALSGCSTKSVPEAQPPAQGIYTAGTYTGTAGGFGGELAVSVEVNSGELLKVEVTKHTETQDIGTKAIDSLPQAIVVAQSTEVDAVAGATVTSEAIKAAVNYALALAQGKDPAETAQQVISTGLILNLDAINTTVAGLERDENGQTTADKGWSVQPKLGITKGDYYKLEELFRQGHVSTLEVVTQGDTLVMVEFNERTRPNYYTRLFAGVPKRMSEYNFDMGAKEGAAWIQGVLLAEQQMMKNQSLTKEVDLVSGASISIKNSMVPMATKINNMLATGSNQKYYSIAEELGGGLTGKLDVVLTNGKITDCRYDEIFADSPEQIEDYAQKKYYRQSKYQSVLYVDPSRVGFAFTMDALNEHVVASQDMFDIANLPSVGEEGDFATTGFTTRNTAWDNYLALAEKLHAEMQADKVL